MKLWESLRGQSIVPAQSATNLRDKADRSRVSTDHNDYSRAGSEARPGCVFVEPEIRQLFSCQWRLYLQLSGAA